MWAGRGFCFHENNHRLFFLISTSAFATSVTPPIPNWSDLAAVNGGYTVSGGAGEAVVSRISTGSLVTNTGRIIPLAANFTAQIPRSTLAQAAAKIIKKAGPAGLLAWGLYELLSPMIGLNSDGTISLSAGTYSADVGSSCYNSSQQWSTPLALADAIHTQCASSGNYSTNCTAIQCTWTYNGGNSSGGPVGVTFTSSGSSVPVPVTEQELKDKIEQSPATPAQIFDRALEDTVRQGIKNKDVQLIPDIAPATATGTPATSPAETVRTTTSPNPDGTTTTTTEQEQVTATPSPRGTTAGDSAVDWNVETSRTTTVRNNTSGETKVTTEVTNAGTSTATKPVPDLCLDHPEILACSQLGDIPADTPTPVTSQSLNVTFTPPSSVAGTCPAPITKTLSGGFQIVQSFTPVCDFAGMMRPVVIAAAFLGAAFIVSGSVRVDS